MVAPSPWATSGTTFTLSEPRLPHVRNRGDDSHILKLSGRLKELEFANVPGTVSDPGEALCKFTYQLSLVSELFVTQRALSKLLNVPA